MNELKSRLVALGLSEEMAVQAIETVAEFAKSKIPSQFHSMLDDVMAGNKPDLTAISGLIGGFKSFFGK